LLWPALRNGYPLLRFDSPVCPRRAGLSFFELRSPGYALFLRGVLASGSRGPPWIQSSVTSWLALRLAVALPAIRAGVSSRARLRWQSRSS
jgi:hypothetical protein